MNKLNKAKIAVQASFMLKSAPTENMRAAWKKVKSLVKLQVFELDQLYEAAAQILQKQGFAKSICLDCGEVYMEKVQVLHAPLYSGDTPYGRCQICSPKFIDDIKSGKRTPGIHNCEPRKQ